MGLLSQPYPAYQQNAQKWRLVFLIGGFVFLFLVVFQPFGLSDLPANKILVLFGYGLITSMVIWLLNFPLQKVYPRFFKEKNWTVLKELAFNALIIMTIAIANWYYTIALGYMKPSFQSFITALLWTFSLGVFPLTVGILLNYYFLLKKNLSEAQSIKRESGFKRLPENEYHQEKQISLYDYSGGVVISLSPLEIIRLEAAGNYVEIHFINSAKPEKILIRNSLKNTLEQLSNQTRIIQTHRSHSINLTHLKSVSGNAQGLQLELAFSKDKIPVARSFISNIKAEIQKLQIGLTD